MLEVIKVIRDGRGNIIAYELDSGSIIDNEQAVYMAKNGELENVEVKHNEMGNEYISGIGFEINRLPELR